MTSAPAKAHVRKPSFGLLAGVVLLLGGEWILLVAGTKLHEMMVGAAAVLLSTIFLVVVWRQSTQRLKFTARDLLECWHIPWYLMRGCWEITLILLKDLLGIEKAGSYFRVSGFRTAKESPELVSKRVLATVYTTASPNFIVIGIDWKQSRMLFHQIKRAGVSDMTKRLGGQS